jgi:poly-gamma-glutamate capsule biosynthesis protein CapA/YwtB (metallophosphatase superfamily)
MVPVSPIPTSGREVATRPTPVVPVAGFWSTRSAISRRDLVRALETGRAPGFDRLAVQDALRGPLEEALRIRLARRVAVGNVTAVERAAAHGALGVLAAPEVSHRVRALEVDGRSLFGNQRVRSNDAWPLSVRLPADGRAAWSQRRTWVLVAAGDSFTDRGVYRRVVQLRKGLDHPFDGGRVRVTGEVCCGPLYGRKVPRYELEGERGIVRRLLRDADVAILNHEQPVTDGWDHHGSGTRFSGKPELTEIFRRAGVDWMSLANNHIKDYATEGILDTRRILKRYGIRSGGAGRDLEQARRISYLEVAGVRLAIVPCVDVALSAVRAGARTSGATPCAGGVMRADLREADRQADVVIAFPHWGVEYSRTPTLRQRAKAARWVRHGADLVLGAHSHVAGAIEEIDGRPVLYSMGNFVFDQDWATFTMESLLVEATFHGDRLVQLRLHPLLIHDQSQPNLLDPRRDHGLRLLRQVRAASDGLDW